jgi:hypothetical protein
MRTISRWLADWKPIHLSTPMTGLRRYKQTKHQDAESNIAVHALRRTWKMIPLFLASGALLLPWIVRWVYVINRRGAYTMDLNLGLLVSPDEVIGLGLHDCDAAGS